MKPSVIFQQYVWLVNLLRRYNRLSFAEINRHWVAEKVNDGNDLSRSTFNRHRDAIVNMFGLIIDCDSEDGYKYYISNMHALEDDTIERWMLSTMTVGGVLVDCAAIHDRILLEQVPAGEEFLHTIITAIKSNHRLLIGYRRFGGEHYEIVVEPYALKLFQRRWYLLTYTGKHIATYSLDRMSAVTLTDEPFEMPTDFSPQAYFDEYFGVLTDETPMEHVAIRAYGKTPDYLRTLPLHSSQRQVSQGEGYTDFALDLRPTLDFASHLLTHTDGIEVLEPLSLRDWVHSRLTAMQQRYETHTE